MKMRRIPRSDGTGLVMPRHWASASWTSPEAQSRMQTERHHKERMRVQRWWSTVSMAISLAALVVAVFR